MALLAVIFLLFLFCIVLYKAVRVLPAYELKRRAKAGDKGLETVYRAASYGIALDLILWLIVAGSLSWSVVMAAEKGAWATVILIFTAVFLMAFIKMPATTSGLLWKAAKYAAWPASILAGFIYPLTRVIFKNQETLNTQATTVFEKQDLINLLKYQLNLPYNRISEKDLQTVKASLSFNGKFVNEVMVTGAKSCFVSGNEPIGPLLMDELHSRGRFAYLVTKGPVKKQSPKPIGTVFVHDLVGHHESGQIKDIAQMKVYYINEDQPIGEALEAMIKTQFPILAVINNFEEVSGVVSLEDIIRLLLPGLASSDFENYANSKVVAGWQKEKSAN